MRRYERRLPHWGVWGQPLFVTFRLHGSVPVSRVFPPQRLTTGRAFQAMDRILDQARAGPLFLRRREIARLVWEEGGFLRVQRYIEWNPVTARLVGSPEEFARSSAVRRNAGPKPGGSPEGLTPPPCPDHPQM